MNCCEGIVFVDNMRVRAFHGVMPQEREVGGDYTVSVKVVAPLDKAAVSDNVEDTVNYAALSEIIKREMKTPSALLEHVAARIAKAVESEFPQTEKIVVCIKKDNPPMNVDCDSAGVEMTFCK